ncbi:ABC transporter permease, partial [Thioclava sp. BHET1]
MGWIIAALLIWGAGWAVNARLASGISAHRPWVRLFVPTVFGLTLLLLWEALVRGLQVPMVILPAPSEIAVKIATSLPILWEDFLQTFVKGALSGYVIGCGAAFVTAVLIDRSPFLRRGLLPVGNFAAALPVVGVAPILVMWFGFDWQSKA